MEWVILLGMLVLGIFGPSIFSGLRERFQSPAENKKLDKTHQDQINADTIQNETERARLYKTMYG